MTAKPTEQDVLTLAHQAGLDLPPAFQQELAAAYALVRQMVAVMPTGRPRGDEPAHSFVATTFLPTEC